MAKPFPELNAAHIDFIQAQQMYFVATAAPEGRVNLSPKGFDSLRVVDAHTVKWLNTTGSGNETAAHLRLSPRMTLMFCAFVGKPKILRLYGEAQCCHFGDPDWDTVSADFPDLVGARQVFTLAIDLVQTSCGMGVPLMDFQRQREELHDHVRGWGEQGLYDYWQRRNRESLDGHETGVPDLKASDE